MSVWNTMIMLLRTVPDAADVVFKIILEARRLIYEKNLGNHGEVEFGGLSLGTELLVAVSNSWGAFSVAFLIFFFCCAIA